LGQDLANKAQELQIPIFARISQGGGGGGDTQKPQNMETQEFRTQQLQKKENI
jgi:hypothetical protein